MSNDESLVKTAIRLHFRKRRHDDNQCEYLMPEQFPEKSSFSIIQTYPALSVPQRMTARLRVELKHLLLQKPRTKNVYRDPTNGNERRLLIFRYPEKDGIQITSISECQEVFRIDARLSPLLHYTTTDSLEPKEKACYWFQNDGHFGYTIERTYDEMTAEEVFQKFFDGDKLMTSSFEVIGQIAHLNLRDEQLPYKYWIAAVLLEKNKPAVRTVVNKVGPIDTAFRTFPMEVLAGYGFDRSSLESDWSVTTTKEEGCTFQLDFRTVYWNSRLSGEHKRLVNIIKKDASLKRQQLSEEDIGAAVNTGVETKSAPLIVADLMAGVGPFAVPLTSERNKPKERDKQHDTARHITNTCEPSKKYLSNIIVHANDLNPESFKYLQINGKRNDCKGLYCYNMDARKFLWELENKMQQQNFLIDHVIMNLPASAPEFLDAFRSWSLEKLPRIHVHCFAPKPRSTQSREAVIPTSTGSKHDDDLVETKDVNKDISNLQQTYQKAVERCSKNLGCPIDWIKDNVDVHLVRDVSPGKNMICVSFTLPFDAKQLPRIELDSYI